MKANTTASQRPCAGCCRQGLEFVLLYIGDRLRSGFLNRDGAGLAAPFEILRTAAGRETGEGPDSGEALVASPRRTTLAVFRVLGEVAHSFAAEVLQGQPAYRATNLVGEE